MTTHTDQHTLLLYNVPSLLVEKKFQQWQNCPGTLSKALRKLLNSAHSSITWCHVSLKSVYMYLSFKRGRDCLTSPFHNAKRNYKEVMMTNYDIILITITLKTLEIVCQDILLWSNLYQRLVCFQEIRLSLNVSVAWPKRTWSFKEVSGSPGPTWRYQNRTFQPFGEHAPRFRRLLFTGAVEMIRPPVRIGFIVKMFRLSAGCDERVKRKRLK